MPNRRSLLLLTTLLIALNGLAVDATAGGSAPLPEHGRALSLRVLQQRATQCQRTGECEAAVDHLAFLRRIDGFVIDEERRDLIFIGQLDTTWPKLHFQDLVIALRDAWHRYTKRRGNALYFNNPGVSIDPDPTVIVRLQEVGRALDDLDNRAQLEQGLETWHRVCHLPQAVRVEGIPFRTRFAAVMLEVDYDLKHLADSGVELPIEGFESLAARYLATAKRSIREGTPTRLSTMSRFWFFPKPLRVHADDTAAIIDPSFGLSILTENEYLDVRGQIVGTGAPDPIAGEFAQSLSALYSEIAGHRPAWRELENLGWMVALARTLRYRNALEQARLDIDWLLEEFPLPDTEVSRTVPGRSNVQRYEFRQAVDGGYLIGTLRLPSCGGVELAVKLDPTSFLPAAPGVQALGHKVKGRRPGADALYWDF